MKINEALHRLFAEASTEERSNIVSIGLGYTAVTTVAGGIGLAYTYFSSKRACQVARNYGDCEGRPVSELLDGIRSEDPLQRSVALAAANALNHEAARNLPQDPTNSILFERLAIGKGSRVAMVGYFGPLIKKIEALGARVDILDDSRGLGQKEKFYGWLHTRADALLLTSTSLLNNTCEEVLAQVGPRVKTAMLGPSTPMAAQAFAHLPVHLLAGTVPMDKEMVLKAVRHGQGTPVIHKYSRKVYLELSRHGRAE